MTHDDIIRMAREVWSAGEVYIGPSEKSLEQFAALVVAAERERIKQKNAPVIERINAHIKALEDAVTDEREWVGLTDEEIAEMRNEIKVRLMGTYKTGDIYRAIEAKLKEKNT